MCCAVGLQRRTEVDLHAESNVVAFFFWRCGVLIMCGEWDFQVIWRRGRRSKAGDVMSFISNT